MSNHQDITEIIERMDPLEDRLGVTIQGLYASMEGPDMTKNTELRSMVNFIQLRDWN